MRKSKDDYYLDIAAQVLKRATCLRRHYGAVIVKDDQIVSTGYCGAPRKRSNCIDLGKCEREVQNVPSGQRYELCRSVHAEMNALINAARAGVSVLGGTLYLSGADAKTGATIAPVPCEMCKRVIINAGIKCVVIRDLNNDLHHIDVEEWTHNENQSTIKP